MRTAQCVVAGSAHGIQASLARGTLAAEVRCPDGLGFRLIHLTSLDDPGQRSLNPDLAHA